MNEQVVVECRRGDWEKGDFNFYARNVYSEFAAERSRRVRTALTPYATKPNQTKPTHSFFHVTCTMIDSSAGCFRYDPSRADDEAAAAAPATTSDEPSVIGPWPPSFPSSAAPSFDWSRGAPTGAVWLDQSAVAVAAAALLVSVCKSNSGVVVLR